MRLIAFWIAFTLQEADLGHKVQSLQETGNSAGQGLKYLTAALKERVRGLTLLYRLLNKDNS